ncbi:MAG: relaxase/mobilization nuclease domain-containing protein [Sphingobacterium sp.]|jgi:hypothetical protein|nr:relaxase/mobilization nuclease domain-containing protein [Sphingobacterium sp.]
MVAVVHLASSLRRVLNYNEQKVKEGVASCIDAAYYLKHASRLSFENKLERLQKLAELNEATKVNTVHISLNFPPEERHSDERLREIARTYMQKIGFGGQPYLLYQHFDAGHPHVHILTTNIKPDGKRISLHNIGKVTSEKARKEIEIEFNLVKAEDKTKRSAYELKPIDTKVEYGQASTKRAITGILNNVLATYKFTTLGELNAVLGLYNVTAEQGAKDSRTYKNNGLVYRIKKEDGSVIGTPIKASLIFGKPTIKNLEIVFAGHKKSRPAFKTKVRVAIDLALLRAPNAGLQQLIRDLKPAGIDTVLHYTKDDKVFGITFVDHKNRCVFNGNALGKGYGAAALMQRCGELSYQKKDLNHISFRIEADKKNIISASSGFTPAPLNPHHDESPENLLLLLFQAERDYNYLPYELSAKKKNKQLKIRR